MAKKLAEQLESYPIKHLSRLANEAPETVWCRLEKLKEHCLREKKATLSREEVDIVIDTALRGTSFFDMLPIAKLAEKTDDGLIIFAAAQEAIELSKKRAQAGRKGGLSTAQAKAQQTSSKTPSKQEANAKQLLETCSPANPHETVAINTNGQGILTSLFTGGENKEEALCINLRDPIFSGGPTSHGHGARGGQEVIAHLVQGTSITRKADGSQPRRLETPDQTVERVARRFKANVMGCVRLMHRENLLEDEAYARRLLGKDFSELLRIGEWPDWSGFASAARAQVPKTPAHFEKQLFEGYAALLHDDAMKIRHSSPPLPGNESPDHPNTPWQCRGPPLTQNALRFSKIAV